jgi:hypothetical protein
MNIQLNTKDSEHELQIVDGLLVVLNNLLMFCFATKDIRGIHQTNDDIPICHKERERLLSLIDKKNQIFS